MAAPPPAVETAGKAAVAHPKAPPRSIKVARSPGPASKPAAAKPAAAGEPAADTDNQEEELLKPKPRAPAAAADDSDSDDK